MTELFAHGVPGSPFLRAVLATAEEKGVAYRLVSLAPDALQSEAHRRLHPFGRIPVIAEALPMARTCVAEFERLLGPSTWLAGESFSLADLMVGPQLEYLSQTPEGRALLGGSRLEAWLTRMATRPSFQATLPPEPLRQAV